MAQVAMRWVLDDPRNHSVCLGAKSMVDYKAAIEACDLPPLGDTVTAALAACAEELKRTRNG